MKLHKKYCIHLVSALAALSLLGCVSNSSNVKLAPDESVVVGVSLGPVFLIDALRPQDRTVFEEAHAAMVLVVNSDQFREKLNKKMLRAGCLSDVRVTGDVIISDLKTKTIPVTLKKKNSRGAKATTNIVKRRMRIDEDRFDNWNVSVRKQAAMVNTLVHETTHLVPYDKQTPPGKHWYYKYYDEDHNSNGCFDNDLVSYVAGNSAEEVWVMMNSTN